MPVVKEAGEGQTSPAIDPTVPTQGIPVDKIFSAEWHEEEEVITAHGFERRIKRKYPKINGEVLNEMTPPTVWRKMLELFPKVPVMIPETDDERERRTRSGSHRAAEPVTWNGVRFTMPKGVAVLVPEPIAQIVEHMNEAYHSVDAQLLIEEMARQMASSRE